MQCETKHKDHKTIYYRNILPNQINKIEEMREYLNKLNNEINAIINKLKYIIKNIEIYYKISNKIINGNYNKNRNYQILKNINEFIEFNNIIINDISNIINENNINNKFKYLMNIYDKMSNIKDNNYIIYKIIIKEKDINKDIRIINSFEYSFRENKRSLNNEEENYNEKDIMQSCEIKINN